MIQNSKHWEKWRTFFLFRWQIKQCWKKMWILEDELFNTGGELLICSFWGYSCEKTCVKELAGGHSTPDTPVLRPLRPEVLILCWGRYPVGWEAEGLECGFTRLIPQRKPGHFCAELGGFNCVSILELYPTHRSLRTRSQGMLKPVLALECSLWVGSNVSVWRTFMQWRWMTLDSNVNRKNWEVTDVWVGFGLGILGLDRMCLCVCRIWISVFWERGFYFRLFHWMD